MKNTTTATAKPGKKSGASSDRTFFAPGSQVVMNWTGPPPAERIKIETVAAVCGIWRDFVATRESFDPSKESLILIALNIRKDFMGWHLVSVGNAIGAMAEPRDIFRAALLMDAVAFVLVHNHPSGCVLPSGSDERVTKLIGDFAKVFGVGFVDHVVVNSQGTESYSIRSHRPDFFWEPGRASKTSPLSSPESAGMAATNSMMIPAARAAEATFSPQLAPEKISLSIPRGFYWSASPVSSFAALSENIRGMTKETWISEWNERRGLKQHHKRVHSFKIRFTHKIEVNADDFQQLQAAALEIGHSPEELLAAKAWKVSFKIPYSNPIPPGSPEWARGKIIQFPS